MRRLLALGLLVAVAASLLPPGAAQGSGWQWLSSSFLSNLGSGLAERLGAGGDSAAGQDDVSTLRNNAKSGFADLLASVRNGTTSALDAVRQGASRAIDEVVKFAVVRSNSEEICFRILGCFSLKSPWISLKRPLPVPRTPDKIDVRFYLYTRDQPQRFSIASTGDCSLDGSTFDGGRATFFLVHGYRNSGNDTWMAALKDAILSKVDGNVFIVDWGHGAQEMNYLQAASNTRVVGREIGYLGRLLISDHGASAADFHLLGHSLGAHISGYAARNITGVGRITAFDPAGPGFEALPHVVRVNKDAAMFVEALHTNAKPVVLMGFGIMQQVAHVDFYLNGGVDQPGCHVPTIDAPKNLLDIASIPKEVVDDLVSCSHVRSHEYFTEAVNNTDCRMWGHQVSVVKQRLMWSRNLASKVRLVTGRCEDAKCVPLGLDAPLYPGRGAFSVVTGSASPFCLQKNSNDGQSLEELSSLGYI